MVLVGEANLQNFGGTRRFLGKGSGFSGLWGPRVVSGCKLFAYVVSVLGACSPAPKAETEAEAETTGQPYTLNPMSVGSGFGGLDFRIGAFDWGV